MGVVRLGVLALLLIDGCRGDDLYVLGLFPIDPAGKGASRGERAEHFRLAHEMLTDRSDGWYDNLLPDTTVHIKIADCEDSAGCLAAMLEARDHLGDGSAGGWPRIDAVVGPYSSSATMATLPVSSHYATPQLSYSATSPGLSGVDPYFFRVCPSDAVKGEAVVQLLEEFGRVAEWSSDNTPEWRIGIIQTDGEFGRGFATRFKGPWERANGGQTQIAGVETIDMAEISSLDFELFPTKMKDELHVKLSELIDTFGARLVLICAHAEDTFKILQLADELERSDVLWIVIDPDTLPQIGSLENIRDGVFGFAEAAPSGARSRQYTQRWRQWGATPKPKLFNPAAGTFMASASNTDPALASSRGIQLPVDKDGDRNTISTYGWASHDVLLAVATAYHNARTDDSDPTDDPAGLLSGRWLPDVKCDLSRYVTVQSSTGGSSYNTNRFTTLLAAQNACAASAACNFVEDRAPIGQGYYMLCSGTVDDLVHCEADCEDCDADAYAQCAHVLDYTPGHERQFSASDNGGNVSGPLLRHHLKLLSLTQSVSGPLSFDAANQERNEFSFNLYNLQDGSFRNHWTVGSDGMSLSCDDGSRPGSLPGSCPGIRFPDGSSTVPQDTVGTKSEQDAESTMTTLMVALVLISAGSVGYWQFAVYKRKHMLRDANEAVLLAVEAKAKAIRQKMDEQSWPKHWKMKAGAAQAQGDGEPEEGLIELDPSEEEYWEVHECLRRETECGQGQMADAWLSKVFRIQNPMLYTYYMFQERRLLGADSQVGLTAKAASTNPLWQAQQGGDDDEDGGSVRCWHGTGSFPAENIYNDTQDGFMMQFANRGYWGRGLYFAREAGYSHHYATKGGHHGSQLANDESEMMLCNLLLGDCATMDRDKHGLEQTCRNLVAPPYLNCNKKTFQGGNGPKYNSVSGWTGSRPRSKVWIVYENGRAYPEYLVRYYRGQRDPSRTPLAKPSAGRAKKGARKRGGAVAAEAAGTGGGGTTAAAGVATLWTVHQEEQQKEVPLPPDLNAQLEAAFAGGKDVCKFRHAFGNAAAFDYEIALSAPSNPTGKHSFVQRNMKTGKTRPVSRFVAVGGAAGQEDWAHSLDRPPPPV